VLAAMASPSHYERKHGTAYFMKLFTGLRKIRQSERAHLPLLKTVIDYDIVIEIGYEEERGHPITLKRLYLLEICSRGTLRRHLSQLVADEMVTREKHPQDGRASLLLIPASTIKLLSKYSTMLSAISFTHFK
jgi:DNA-binding MarR family transcriptional regulator